MAEVSIFTSFKRNIKRRDSSPATTRGRLSYRCTLHNLSLRNAFSTEWRGSCRIFRCCEATSIESSGIVTCVYSLLLVCRVNNTMHESSIKPSAIKTRYVLRIPPNFVGISATMLRRECSLEIQERGTLKLIKLTVPNGEI